MREVISTGYDPPRFCYHCGAALPWTTRVEILSKIEDAILDEPGLDPSEKGSLRAGLAKIETGAADEGQQASLWPKGESP
jgi:hypothetical protein